MADYRVAAVVASRRGDVMFTSGARWRSRGDPEPFARLWYYEELHPLVFAVEGLAAARALNFPECM
ncbi:MAG: hypothetical protein ABI868_21510 [Acidobacteriota bacterium]